MKDFYSIRDSYKIYKENNINTIEYSVFSYIVKIYMKFLIDKLFTTGELIIPERIGKIQIIGKKQKIKIEEDTIKGLAPDWKSTKELWEKDPKAKENKQVVYHFNENTNGIRYKFLWSKDRVLLSNKTLYDLRMTRENKRRLAKTIQGGKEYLIIGKSWQKT